jgi:hypothetical protein
MHVLHIFPLMRIHVLLAFPLTRMHILHIFPLMRIHVLLAFPLMRIHVLLESTTPRRCRMRIRFGWGRSARMAMPVTGGSRSCGSPETHAETVYTKRTHASGRSWPSRGIWPPRPASVIGGMGCMQAQSWHKTCSYPSVRAYGVGATEKALLCARGAADRDTHMEGIRP